MGAPVSPARVVPDLGLVFFSAPVLTLLVGGCGHDQLMEPGIPTDHGHHAAASRPQLAAPTGASAVATAEAEIRVSWQDRSSTETGFEVHRATTATGPFSLLSTTTARVVAYADRKVGPAQQYCYRVRAVRVVSASKVTYSTFSSTACATPVLAPPSGAQAVAASETQIDVTWQDNSSFETGLEVHRAAFPGGSFTLRATLGPGATTFSDTGLDPGTQYCYRLRAAMASGTGSIYSTLSDAACAATKEFPPAAPSGVLARPSSSSTVSILWADNSSDEDSFRIEQSSDGGIAWSLYSIAAAGATRADRVPAVAEQQACYRVVAVNTGGETPSDADCTTPPLGPTNAVMTGVDANTITMTWSDNSAVEDGYEVRMWETNCLGPVCNAFDPWCENYGWCEATRLVAALPANATAYTGPLPTSMTSYRVVYVVATKDGGNSDPSDPRVPLYSLE